MSVATAPLRAPEATLREVVDALCAIERPPCSEGERQAAEWLRARLAAAGVDRVEVERETGYGTYPKTMLALGALAIAGVGNHTMPSAAGYVKGGPALRDPLSSTRDERGYDLP